MRLSTNQPRQLRLPRQINVREITEMEGTQSLSGEGMKDEGNSSTVPRLRSPDPFVSE